MSTGARSIRSILRTLYRGTKTTDEPYRFFCPLLPSLPHVCSNNIIRDIFSNAKCNFSEAGCFYKVNTI